MNRKLIKAVVARLGDNERRVMALPTVQLAMLEGRKGITVEKHDKVPASTIRSLIARNLVTAKPDKNSGVMPLTSMGEQVNAALCRG